MGVDRTDYLMWAADLGGEEIDYDKHEAEIDGAPNRKFDIVYDGMCGQYTMAGKIIASCSGDGDGGGFELVKIDPADLKVDAVALADAVSEAFDRKLVPSDFSLILFSHFS